MAESITPEPGSLLTGNGQPQTLWGLDTALVDLLPVAVSFHDADGAPLRCNRAARELGAGNRCSCCGAALTQALRTGQPQRIANALHELPDGSRHCVRALIDPIRDAAGTVIGAVSVLVDLGAEQVQAIDADPPAALQEALRASEQRFTRFAQHLPGLAWIKDLEGRYVYANDAALKAFRSPSAELYGKTDDDLFLPQTAAQFRENDRKALTSGAGVQVLETLEHEDGLHSSIVSKFPIPGPDGTPALVGGVAFDITDLKNAEEALRTGEERLRLALDAGHMGVWDWDLRSNTIWWSDNLEAIHGLTPGSFGGTLEAFDRLLHPDDRQAVKQTIAQAIEKRSRYDTELRTIASDGSVRWMIGKGKVVCDEAGQPVRMVGVGMDVTARKQAEEALQRSEQFHRAIAELTSDYAFSGTITPEGHVEILSVSEGYEKFYGYTLEEMNARGGWGSAIHRDDHPLVAQSIGQLLAGAVATGEVRGLCKDGSVKWQNYLCVPIRDRVSGQVTHLYGAARDVTGQRHARQALEESEQRFRTLAGHVPVGIFQTDAQGQCVYVNERWCQLTGLTPDEALGTGWMAALHEGDRAWVAEKWQRGVATGGLFTNEYRFQNRTGEIVWIYTRAVPLHNEQGELIGYLGTATDVTEQKKLQNDLWLTKEIAEQRAAELDAVIESMPDAVFFGTAAGITKCNANALKMLGMTSLAELQHDIQELAERLAVRWPDSGEPLRPEELPFARALRGETTIQELMLRPLGAAEDMHVRVAAAPVLLNGEIVGAVLVNSDVTKRKDAEEALRETSATLRGFYDTAPVMMGVVEVTADDILHLTDNAATGRFFGVSPDHLTGRWASTLGVPAHTLSAWVGHYRASAHSRQPVRFEYSHQTAEGERWVSAIVYCIERLPGDRCRCSYVAEDVTERKRVEQALREAERRWRDLAEALPNLVWTDPPNGQCDYMSSQWGKYTGIPENELLGLRWLEVLHPDDRQRTLECWQKACADQGVYDLEYRIRRHDGQYRWFKTRGVPIRDEQGRIIKWFGTCTDIEDQKQIVEALRRSEERFRQLADAMPQIVFTARPDGQTEYLNRRWYVYTGLPEGEVSAASWLSVLHPDDRGPCIAEAERTNRAGIPFEMELRLREAGSGEYRWHLSRSLPVCDETGQLVRWYGTSTDIHDQKKAGDAARFLADASATLATVGDYESTLQKVAALAVPHFADWSAVDMVAADGSLRRLAVVHQVPEKIQLARELMQRYPPDPNAAGGIALVLRTGQPDIITDLTDAMLVQGARDEEHLRLMRALELRSYIIVPLSVSGKTLGALTFATAESGRHYSRADLSLAEDLAHRAAIAIENARLYRELREADRRKDEFLATLAHELRNPLAPVRNALQILKMPRLDAATAERSREMMERQVHHLVRLVDDLLDVSRVMRGKIELRKERVELATVIARAIETAQPHIEAQGHELTIQLADESLLLEADPVRLAQVIGNLLTNAAKYTEPRGRIWVTAQRQGNQAILRVLDNGIGMAPDLLPRVFDLFVQADHAAKRSQGGLGIGLTLVKSLIEMHHGTVEARSPGLGRGSEFVVRLPLTPTPVATAAGSDSGSSTLAPGGRRLLVVDDNKDAADSLAMLLRMLGHDVQVAHDGRTALEYVKTQRPELVLLDLGMPGMDGFEVARRLRDQPERAGLVLAALTGWGQESDRQRTAEAGFDHHLVKPVDVQVLEELLAGLGARKG